MDRGEINQTFRALGLVELLVVIRSRTSVEDCGCKRERLYEGRYRLQNLFIFILHLTRCLTIGATRRIAAPLDWKIPADILGAISGDLASNRDRIIRLFASSARFTHFYAAFNCVLQSIGNN